MYSYTTSNVSVVKGKPYAKKYSMTPVLAVNAENESMAACLTAYDSYDGKYLTLTMEISHRVRGTEGKDDVVTRVDSKCSITPWEARAIAKGLIEAADACEKTVADMEAKAAREALAARLLAEHDAREAGKAVSYLDAPNLT